MAVSSPIRTCLRIILMLAVFGATPTGFAAASAPYTAESRLAGVYVRAARSLLSVQPLFIENVEIAVALADEAHALAPDDPEILRFLLDVALMSERTDIYETGIKRLVQLDPADDAALLRRLNLLIEEQNTVGERIVIYDKLLARAELGNAVRSRLALDKAILLERNGDVEAFAEALSQAVQLDPSNRTAAAIAAGFFRMNVNDPYAEAELLLNVVLADPTDLITQASLARHLLEHGAYDGAARIYQNTIRGARKLGTLADNNFLADCSLAFWAAGESDKALRLIDERQHNVDLVYRSLVQQARVENDQPHLNPLELAQLHGHVSPALAVVRVAVLAQQRDPLAGEALGRALHVYRDTITEGGRDGTLTDQEFSELTLELAMLFLWLGNNVDPVPKLLYDAQQRIPLSESAQQRFDGWRALRAGAYDDAIELLRDLADDNAVAAIGLAQAHLRKENKAEAARIMLATARAYPSSVFGVWASHKLSELVGTRAPTTDLARRLNGLIATIPPSFDRFIDSPGEAIEMTVSASKSPFQPYEPVIVNIELSNNSPYPLAIDRDGPIRSLVLLQVGARFGPAAIEREMPDIIVPIDRRLRLAPRERVVIPIDLRTYEFGRKMDETTILGAGVTRGTLVNVNAISNFTIKSSGVIQPMLLGAERYCPPFRVEGIERTKEWYESTVAGLTDGHLNDDDIIRTAMLGHQIGYLLQPEYQKQLQQLDATDPVDPPRVEQYKQQLEQRIQLYTSVFLETSPIEQAWLLSTLPAGNLPQQIFDHIRQTDDRLIRLTYLMFHLSARNDEILLTARQGDDPQLRAVGDAFERQFAYRQLQRERQEAARRRGGASQ